ncbi:MAG: histidine triad nucleotide-binding protein [Gemmatimonadetes bacterium]|nr:histidine triad nucleotide-binding protein [Gemmatimonadota bacterium]
MADCIFCRIARHEIPATVVREDEDCIAFRDLLPRAPVHVLIIPKRHIASVNELTGADETVVGHLVAAARAVAESEGVAESGYRLVLNAGPDAGQSVDHLHLHLLGGRELGWPPG